MNYCVNANEHLYERDKNKLEIVTVSVGFDDVLDVTLPENHGQCDHLIVVTSHDDRKTQVVCRKHGVTCVPTDVFTRHENEFRKGAGITRGFDFLQYYGWRLVLDADIILPHNFHRLLFNHSHLDSGTIYGMDRMDVVGLEELKKVKDSLNHTPQHAHGFLIRPAHFREIGSRYLDNEDGYCPIGFFQLTNAKSHKKYPSSKGSAAHDDVSYAKLFPRDKRHILPLGFVYHLVPKANQPIGLNWEGKKQEKIY